MCIILWQLLYKRKHKFISESIEEYILVENLVFLMFYFFYGRETFPFSFVYRKKLKICVLIGKSIGKSIGTLSRPMAFYLTARKMLRHEGGSR